MKRLSTTIQYKVPSWNFCNKETFDLGCEVSKETCRFCVKGRCLLYDKSLTVEGRLINKLPECCTATVNGVSTSNLDSIPTVPPKDLMKQAIDLYVKTQKDLMSQGYPQPIAENVAKKYVLGD